MFRFASVPVILAIALGCLASTTVSRATASVYCTTQFEFLSERDSTFWLLERKGNDCDGESILSVSVQGDSVLVQHQRFRLHPADSLLQEQLLGFRESVWDDRGVARELLLPDAGLQVTAPEFVLDFDAALRQKRLPEFSGASARPLYWHGCGKYLNYYLKTAFFSSRGDLLLLITHSEWEEQKVGHDLQCAPGDGFIVFRLADFQNPFRISDGPVLVELAISQQGDVVNARIIRGAVSPQEQKKILGEVGSYHFRPREDGGDWKLIESYRLYR